MKKAKKTVKTPSKDAYTMLYLVTIGMKQAITKVKIVEKSRFFYDDKNLKKVFKRDAKKAERILCKNIAKDFNFDLLVDI